MTRRTSRTGRVSFDKRGRPGSSAAAPDYDFAKPYGQDLRRATIFAPASSVGGGWIFQRSCGLLLDLNGHHVAGSGGGYRGGSREGAGRDDCSVVDRLH